MRPPPARLTAYRADGRSRWMETGQAGAAILHRSRTAAKRLRRGGWAARCRKHVGEGAKRFRAAGRICLAAVPLGVFTTVACFHPVLPHWGLIGLTSLLPMLGLSWHRQLIRRPASARQWLATAVVFSLSAARVAAVLEQVLAARG